MQVILLEKVGRLGSIGSVVKVADGFARNFLIPRKKALRATKENLAYYEAKRAEIERANQEKKAAAEALLPTFENQSVTIARQCGDDGRLYGSVTTADIAKALTAKTGIEIHSEQVLVYGKLKETGTFKFDVELHADVKVEIDLVITRSEGNAAVA